MTVAEMFDRTVRRHPDLDVFPARGGRKRRTRLDPIRGACIANARESRILSPTRDLLLPRLMRGDIRLREVERAVKAVA